MSTLYKEALIESQNLKKLAQDAAEKKILEDISPLIKKAITEQINEAINENFFIEDSTDGDASLVDPTDSTIDPTGLSNSQVGGLPNPEPAAPLSPRGNEPNVMSATMPGQDGKITVDFEDLFTSGDALGMSEPTVSIIDAQPPVPVEEPQTVPMPNVEPMEVTRESFEKDLSETEKKINEAFYFVNLTTNEKEKIQQNLFNLLENLDFLRQKKIINQNIAQKSEKKLEFLFLKLKEAKLSNSYIETDRRDSNKMKSLKEYAAKLFEEDSTYSETADKNLNHKSTASEEHAMKQSGVSPEVGGPESLKAKTEKQNAKAPAEKQWAEGEPGLKEEVDVNEAELKEALESLTGSPEKDKGWEQAEPEEEDPSHKKLKEGFEDLDAGAMGAPSDDDLDSAVDAIGDIGEGEDVIDPDIVLNIELPDEIEDALANIDLSSMGDVKVDVASSTLGSVGTDMDTDPMGGTDDMELDFGDDSTDDLSAPPAGEDEDLEEGLKQSPTGHIEGTPQYDSWQRGVERQKKEKEERIARGEKPGRAALSVDDLKEAVTKLLKNKKMLEAKLAQVEAENKNLKESVQKDRTALKEANLFLAKNVYFTKFLQRNDISKKNLKKIVEYLDRAETVNDAKSIYNKIKVKLTESAKASNKLVGSPSKVTTPGSVQTLNENANPSIQTEEDGFIDGGRWAELAGIKKSK